MERRRIPAPLSTRVVRGISITVVLAMAMDLAPFAPMAPASAGLFGSVMLKALLATLAVMALLGEVTARPLAVAVAAAGSCHILQAGNGFGASPATHPFDWLIPMAGAMACLSAIVGLGLGAPELEDRRQDAALPRNASWQRRLLGRRAAVQGHRRPRGAIQPVRVAPTYDHSTPRPHRIKPLKARAAPPAASDAPVEVTYPVIRPMRASAGAQRSGPPEPEDILLLTAAQQVVPGRNDPLAQPMAQKQAANG